jgi:Cu-Zn family superoxide dismutase
MFPVNPANISHGDINAPVSHAGDLGNMPTDDQGNAKGSVTARFVTLSGPNSVLGRTFIIHGGRDDLGTGAGDSKTTGNSGFRVACGIIMA